MSLRRGQPVAIVNGKNKGLTGTFEKTVGMRYCVAVLDGSTDEQRFYRTSVKAAMVVVPPFSPPAHAMPARATPARKKRPEDSEAQAKQLMIEEMLNDLEQAKNVINSLEDKLQIMTRFIHLTK
jgi:hypothetical protein